jgi:prepilin-type N-terminal cleavage/methylation domain-containing protein
LTTSRSTNRGFTLLELLVAIGITAAIAAAILGITRSTLQLWQRTQDALTADTQARVALDYLERDLESALFRSDGHTWLAIDVTNAASSLTNHGWLTTGTSKPAGATSTDLLASTSGELSRARFGLSGAWLRFFTTNVESGASLPIAVSYQLARRPVSGAIATSNPAAVRYGFFRSAVSSDQTFTTGYDLLSGYAWSSSSPPGQRSPGTLTNPNTTSDLLATNVIDFGVWLHVRETTGGLRRIFPESGSDLTHRAATLADFPDVADVVIRVLTEKGAQQLDQLENSRPSVARPPEAATDADWWWSIAESNSRVYVRRIVLRPPR